MNEKLLAAAVKRDITPSKNQLMDFGAFDCFYQKVYARVTVLSNGIEHFVIVNVELKKVPDVDGIRKQICTGFHVRPSAVLLTCTNNSLAVITDKAEESGYVTSVHDQIMDALKEVFSKLEPARMGAVSVESRLNVNCYWPTPVGILRNANYQGYSDKEMVVLRVENASGLPIAILCNYGMQANMLEGLKEKGGFTKFGGDLPGAICEYVEKAYGNGCVATWIFGAGCDQMPLLISRQENPVPDENGGFRLSEKILDEKSTFAVMEYFASLQGMDIFHANERISALSDKFDLRFAEIGREIDKGWENRPKLILSLAVLNGVAFAGANFEPCSSLGHTIRKVLPYGCTFIAGGCLGDLGEILSGCELNNSDEYTCDAWESEKAVFEGFRDLAKMVL
jgi:hypothetical protein